MLDKLHQGISSKAVGCDFSVHIPPILLNKEFVVEAHINKVLD